MPRQSRERRKEGRDGTPARATFTSRRRSFRAATCAARTKGSYYKDKYHRLKARRGAQRAAMAIAHKILVAVFHVLAGDTEFRELGAAHLDQQNKHRVTKGLVRRLDALGYEVILRPKLAA